MKYLSIFAIAASIPAVIFAAPVSQPNAVPGSVDDYHIWVDKRDSTVEHYVN
ncbi:uncharacterized protein RCC_05271 [Ramularia collo-cygni]|uniref:Uncharacterized protein n=1 Tax=Ramularia collo-cygni TaxID=112498 RepID=A0A2D3V1S5_9PEZI|nr:uncharacterized protein RCC_05271 [Ramularia collo-cygni]CZT19420.1 uncharacterized protein RCC_05271 [Ramularia collo-cygni]